MSATKLENTWGWLWDKHQQTKNIIKRTFTFFTTSPNKTFQGAGELPNSNGGEGGNKSPKAPYERSYSTKQRVGLILGPLFFILILLFLKPDGLEMNAISTLGIVAWVATWWITEAVPIPVASVLPVILYPLTGALEPEVAYAPYANDIIFLIMGGFVVALAMEKWKLHKRIALLIVSISGTSTNRVILGFVAATGFLSMWISNTATTMLMVPIAIALVQQVQEALKGDSTINTRRGDFVFGKSLMLAIAYSATVGGLGTIVGSPGNAIFVGVVSQLYDIQITFAQWMIFGIPISILLLGIVWVLLTKVVFPVPFKELPGGTEYIQSERVALGNMSKEEKLVLVIFSITAFCWITRAFLIEPFLPGLTDAIIAVIAALVLFMMPAPNNPGKRLLDWEVAKDLPWGIALLYGAGLSLAAGFTETGLSAYLGEQLTVLEGIPLFVILIILVALTIVMTELMSNGASATMLYPIMGALAFALGVHPYGLMLAACLAVTASFMLPVSTPPNAIVFGTYYVRMNDMLKAGVGMNLIIILLVPPLVYFVIPALWGFNIFEFPASFLQ